MDDRESDHDEIVNIVACQLNVVWEDQVGNFKKVRSLVNRRTLVEGSLLLLPEMFATGFSMNVDKIAEGADGPTSNFMRELALAKKVYVLGGLVRQDAGARIYNEAVCYAPSGKCLARYAKLHLFTPGGETDHYTPGTDLALFHWGGFGVAVYICYDLRFPEVFRMAARSGAGVFVVIANWPEQRQSHWTTLLRARAIENQGYVVGVNRCGHDPQLAYAGGSVVIDPLGETVASANSQEAVLSAELDPAALFRCRRDFAALKDIRTDFSLMKKRTRRQ